jgi:AraC-like DNA-binding protein
LNKQNHLSDRKVIFIADTEDQGQYHRVDVTVISNVHEASCLNLLNFFKSVKPLVNVIVVTQNGSEDFAVAAFRKGATDYFSAPFDAKDLGKRIRCVLSSEEVKNRRRADYGLDNFRDAVNYIADNYNSKIELSCMAHVAGMSVSCFQRAFKKKMGVTFTVYVTNLRISRAKKMLENRNLSIGEIAYSNGFSNQYHFTRTFKKITNISPRLYRNSLNQ